MKAWVGFALACIPFLTKAATLAPLEHVSAPGGKIVYYVLGDDSKRDSEEWVGGEALQAKNITTGKDEILLKSKPDSDPKKTLYGFANIKLSPDSKTLYFESSAWATSAAIHALDITSHKTNYVTDGSLICVVGSGEHQGGLIVQQHRYFVQGGAYNYLYLYEPSGKLVGLVAGERVTREQVLELCQTL